MTGGREPHRDIEKILAHTTEADFSGHGNFHSLSPAERLEWLDEAARFVAEFKGLARQERPPASS
jgi:hypothetical protein